jgi:hypothetical protein
MSEVIDIHGVVIVHGCLSKQRLNNDPKVKKTFNFAYLTCHSSNSIISSSAIFADGSHQDYCPIFMLSNNYNKLSLASVNMNQVKMNEA